MGKVHMNVRLGIEGNVIVGPYIDTPRSGKCLCSLCVSFVPWEFSEGLREALVSEVRR